MNSTVLREQIGREFKAYPLLSLAAFLADPLPFGSASDSLLLLLLLLFELLLLLLLLRRRHLSTLLHELGQVEHMRRQAGKCRAWPGSARRRRPQTTGARNISSVAAATAASLSLSRSCCCCLRSAALGCCCCGGGCWPAAAACWNWARKWKKAASFGLAPGGR